MLGLFSYLRVQIRTTLIKKEHCFIQASSADEDDQNDNYDSGIYPNLNFQNLLRINQRKGHCFTQAVSDDEDDQYDEYNSSVSII